MVLLLLFLLLAPIPCNAKYHSQLGQDKFFHENFFRDLKGGVFLDIGAHDGIRYSNTYFFETVLGWHGLCAEPNPELFKKLQACRKAVCVNGCIAPQSGKAQFLCIKNNPRALDGPDFLSGIVDLYDPKHMERINQEVAETGATMQLIDVECYRLNDLLEAHGMYQIDYLSLDTEGGELEILKSIDFDRFKIHIIDVENNYADPEFARFLASKGFKFIKNVACDEFYINYKNRRAQS